ncbi:hypothetical protein PR048_003518 [Dryococelus australis]|uniref:Uncharacterized protein n=1 Tax=Dryococelus australis TaxID=614101 RepID=A0ABQ9IN92_9NEOP|nr:hypothetical protein PR048_003518 [Dryococelus australis]
MGQLSQIKLRPSPADLLSSTHTGLTIKRLKKGKYGMYYIPTKWKTYPHCPTNSTHGEPGSFPGGVTPGFSHEEIMPDYVAGQRIFSGISRFPPPLHSGAALNPPHLYRLAVLLGVAPQTEPHSGATVAERLAHSPPTTAIRAQSSVGSIRISAYGNRAGRCRWSAGFLGDLPFPPPFRSGAAPYSSQSPSSALKTSMLRAAQISSPFRTPLKVSTRAMWFCGEECVMLCRREDPLAPRSTTAWKRGGAGCCRQRNKVQPGVGNSRNRIRLERVSQKQYSDTYKTPYDRVKRCRESKINIKASERVNVDVFTQNKRPCPQHSHTPFFCEAPEPISNVYVLDSVKYADSSECCGPATDYMSIQKRKIAACIQELQPQAQRKATMPLVGGFSRGHSGAAPYAPHFTLIGSRDPNHHITRSVAPPLLSTFACASSSDIAYNSYLAQSRWNAEKDDVVPFTHALGATCNGLRTTGVTTNIILECVFPLTAVNIETCYTEHGFCHLHRSLLDDCRPLSKIDSQLEYFSSMSLNLHRGEGRPGPLEEMVPLGSWLLETALAKANVPGARSLSAWRRPGPAVTKCGE